MKKSITFYVAAAILTLFIAYYGCDSKKQRATKAQTAQVIAVFLRPDSSDANYDVLWRVIKDSIIVDTNNVKQNKVFIDSSYYWERRDTVMKDGRPQLDSLGRILTRPTFIYIPKSSVWDVNLVVDSARRRFDPFIKKKDTTAKK